MTPKERSAIIRELSKLAEKYEIAIVFPQSSGYVKAYGPRYSNMEFYIRKEIFDRYFGAGSVGTTGNHVYGPTQFMQLAELAVERLEKYYEDENGQKMHFFRVKKNRYDGIMNAVVSQEYVDEWLHRMNDRHKKFVFPGGYLMRRSKACLLGRSCTGTQHLQSLFPERTLDSDSSSS